MVNNNLNKKNNSYGFANLIAEYTDDSSDELNHYNNSNVHKNNVHKNNAHKNNAHKNNAHKNNAHKNNAHKNNAYKNNARVNNVLVNNAYKNNTRTNNLLNSTASTYYGGSLPPTLKGKSVNNALANPETLSRIYTGLIKRVNDPEYAQKHPKIRSRIVKSVGELGSLYQGINPEYHVFEKKPVSQYSEAELRAIAKFVYAVRGPKERSAAQQAHLAKLGQYQFQEGNRIGYAYKKKPTGYGWNASSKNNKKALYNKVRQNFGGQRSASPVASKNSAMWFV
jgi:hypothetical protein